MGFCYAVALTVLLTAATLSAQAWAPPAGTGAASLVHQRIEYTGHRLTDGSMLRGYDSESRTLLLDLDYALTDRLSVSVGVPYVFARYRGPEPSFFGVELDECRCWNRGFQDLSVTARYNLLNHRYAVMPFVTLGIPSHSYDYVGEAVLGRNLREIRLGLAAGQRLDGVSPRLAVQQRYSYSFVERVLDLPNNRSNFSVEPAFQITRRLAARAMFAWQYTHGGLRATEFATDEQWAQYDRIIRDNNFQAGAGLAYAFPRFDLFVSYLELVSGTDTHAGNAVTVGVSWPFDVRQ